ncbi:MAG TPA: SDR family oxidoreductase [Holophagaceae bacterium]|nr:SDR family oxidoreductase [Holophagaceae bacterium]
MTGFADYDSIQVGDRRHLVKVITEADLRKFVEMTGDDNPLHVDRGFAEGTAFKDIVVHGMLGASFLSTVIGTRLPGPGALWVAQSMEFLHPVRLGDELTVSCTVQKKHDRERLLELETRIENQHGQTVLLGTGKVKVLAPKVAAPPEAADRRPRVALVSGGAGGIGRAVCLRLAREGFAVAVNYASSRDRAEAVVAEIEAAGGRALAVQGDVSTEEGAAKVVRETLRAFGGVGVLVHNASPRIHPKPFPTTAWNDLQRHLDVQVRGAFLLAQACLPGMVEQRHGRIIHITSQVVDGPPVQGWTAYVVAKAALAALARQLAVEFGPSGITVNCVAPGMTETALIGDIPEKAQLMAARQTPLRRLAQPADVAAAVAHLASDDAAYVTGQTLAVNGGAFMP